MKALLSVLSVVVILTLASFTARQAGPVNPVYTLSLSPQQAQALLYIIDKSTAEHTVVSEVQKAVLAQFQAQTDAMQKAAESAADSTAKPAKKAKN